MWRAATKDDIGKRCRIKRNIGDDWIEANGFMIGKAEHTGAFPKFYVKIGEELDDEGFTLCDVWVNDILTVQPRIPTWETLQEGDVLIDDEGDTRQVQGVLGSLVFYSKENDYTAVHSYYTKSEIKGFGWRLYGESPEPVTYSHAEVAQKLGMKPELLKIEG